MHLGNRSGTDVDEQRRFAAMNDMLNPTSIGMLRLRGGERILDVGCGLGQLTRAMARAAGAEGRVLGIVRCPSWLMEARRQAAEEKPPVEFRAGEPHDLPLSDGEWGTYDLVHARFLLGQVAAPERVLEAAVRAARPGGRIVLEDDDHAMLRIWPEPDGFAPLWDGYARWCESQAVDPYVGRRLISLLHGAGAVPVRSPSLSVSACAGSPSFKPLLGIVAAMFESAGDAMKASGTVEEAAVDAGIQGLRDWSRRPDAAPWYTTCWAEGRRPST